MDKHFRNARVYESLLGMGLLVERVPEAQNPHAIDYMIVTVDPRALDRARQAIGAGGQAPGHVSLIGDAIQVAEQARWG